jgi:hypothetical protein
MSTIIILIILLIMLIPSIKITIESKLFLYEYSADRFYKRHRQFFNYIRFHWWNLDEHKLLRFYKGGYINRKQYDKLCKSKKLWNYELNK